MEKLNPALRCICSLEGAQCSEEMSVEEIGEVLGTALNTVRTHLHRSLRAIRSQLEHRDAG